MSREQTFATLIIATSILILVVSAHAFHPRDHINHFNRADATNGNGNGKTVKGLGKAIGRIANAASNIAKGIASSLKPNYTEYPPAALAQEFILAHNEARKADNIQTLVWNDTLAQIAENWARQQKDCGMRHSPYTHGENLFWGYDDHWLPRQAVEDWASEKQFYNRETKTCAENKACGHYTQIIWKTTEQVGCTRFRCFNGSLLIICEYEPPGNYVGEDPFNPRTFPKKTTSPPPPSSSHSPTSPPSSSSPSPSPSPPLPPQHMPQRRKGHHGPGQGHHAKRKSNNGPGRVPGQDHNVPGQGDNMPGQDHNVPGQGDNAPHHRQGHGQGGGHHRGGHHRQRHAQAPPLPPLVVQYQSAQHKI